MQQVCVHDVGTELADLCNELGHQLHVQVATRVAHGYVDARRLKLADEALSLAGREHTHTGLDTHGAEGGQQGKQVALRSGYPLGPLDVKDPHRHLTILTVFEVVEG